MTTHLRKFATPLALAAFLAIPLMGCVQPAAYAPRVEGAQTGYTDKEITPTRYRVTFSGNSATPRETVENYLMLRAAEVSLAAGSSHFMFDTRDTKARTRYDAVPEADPFFYGPGFGGYNARGFYGRGFGGRGFYGAGFGGGFGGGWRFHPAFGYSAFGPPVDVIASTKFDAYAEIVLLSDAQAAKEPRAVDAHAVVEHLGPTAVPAAQASVKVTPAT